MDVELGRLLRRASRSAARQYRLRVAELSLTQRQASAVLALVETPGQPLNGLAETLGSDQATASALVDRLLAAGLARRETDPDDRRRARLYPTARASELAAALAAARSATELLIRSTLGSRDSAELARLLERLSDGLSAEPAAARRERRA